jgi:hypothetical protein
MRFFYPRTLTSRYSLMAAITRNGIGNAAATAVIDRLAISAQNPSLPLSHLRPKEVLWVVDPSEPWPIVEIVTKRSTTIATLTILATFCSYSRLMINSGRQHATSLTLTTFPT